MTVEERWAINWPVSAVDISSRSRKFERMIEKADNPRSLSIAKNTREFYYSIREQRTPEYCLAG